MLRCVKDDGVIVRSTIFDMPVHTDDEIIVLDIFAHCPHIVVIQADCDSAMIFEWLTNKLASYEPDWKYRCVIFHRIYFIRDSNIAFDFKMRWG